MPNIGKSTRRAVFKFCQTLAKFEENCQTLAKRSNEGIIHYNFAHRIRFDNKDWIARLVVRESNDGKLYYDHEFSGVEEMKAAGAPPSGRGGTESVATPPHQPGSDLLQKIFAVNPESVTKVVDENGEPLVVWHGSQWNPLVGCEGGAARSAEAPQATGRTALCHEKSGSPRPKGEGRSRFSFLDPLSAGQGTSEGQGLNEVPHISQTIRRAGFVLRA